MNEQFFLEAGTLYWRGKDKSKLLVHTGVLGAACVGRSDVYYVTKSAETGRFAPPLTATRGSIEKGLLRTTACEELGRGGRYLYVRDEPRNLALVLESGKLLPAPLGSLSLLEDDPNLVTWSTARDQEMFAATQGDALWLWQPGSSGFQHCGDWGIPAGAIGYSRMKSSPSGRWLARYSSLESSWKRQYAGKKDARPLIAARSAKWVLHFYNVESRRMLPNPVILHKDVTVAQWYDDDDILAVNTVTGAGDKAIYKGVYIDPNTIP